MIRRKWIMKIKSMTKYSFNGALKAYLIFAAIIFAIINTVVIITAATGSQGGSFGGMDFSTVVFMFILGIVNYREDLSMSIQNGISRKSYFCSTILVFILIAVIGSAGDTLISILGNFYQNNVSEGISFDSGYEQLFMWSKDIIEPPTPEVFDYIKGFILQITFNIAALAGGLLFASVIYRLSKVFKFIIPAAFYVLIFIALPIVDYSVFDFAITKNVSKLLAWMSESVWHMSSVFAGLAAILFAVSYLFVRRVQINDRK